MLLTSLRTDIDTFAAGTGWHVEPRGACQGELCVPLERGSLDGATVDVARVAARLGMALVEDDGRWALGPASFSGQALASTQAPHLTLETFAGEPFALSSLRGTRYVLVAWAPY